MQRPPVLTREPKIPTRKITFANLVACTLLSLLCCPVLEALSVAGTVTRLGCGPVPRPCCGRTAAVSGVPGSSPRHSLLVPVVCRKQGLPQSSPVLTIQAAKSLLTPFCRSPGADREVFCKFTERVLCGQHLLRA